MATRNDHQHDHGWRSNTTKSSEVLKNLRAEESFDRVDSGFGDDQSLSISNEDRSSTGSDSFSDRNRNQVCSDTGLEQKTKELTLSCKTKSYKSAGYQSDSGLDVEERSMSYPGTEKPSFLNSFAQSNDIRYLLAPFYKCLTTQNQDGDTSLHLAIINCQEEVVNAILDVLPTKECLDIYNYLTQTPLHLAVITRQPRVIQKLIDQGASVDLPDRNGQTCLHLACQRGDVKLIKAIFKPRPHKPDIHEKLHEILEMRNFEGLTPLHMAVLGNSLDVVRELMSLGADVNTTDGKSGHTALHLAVEHNNLQIVSELLFQGNAYANATSYSECTPLHIAAGLGLKPIVASLIAAGADASLKNSEGDTPFELANEYVQDIFDGSFEPMEE